MKKTLAMLLSFVLVASVCGVMFVSAESVNLAAGKEVANAENVAADVTTLWIDTDLTDGKAETGWNILWTAGQWFGYWWNPDSASAADWTNAPEGVATPTIDLGAVCSVDKVRVNMFLGSDMGIIPAESVTVKVSTDGENYTDVATTTIDAPAEGDTTVGWVEFALEAPVDAQYVCVEMVLGAVWLFVDEIEVYGTAPATEEPDAPVAGKNWENTLVEGEDGNYSCEVPYGYTWNVNYVDSTIVGEDITVCTTQEAYNACNPNWAITVYLEKQDDGTYVALQDAIVCPGSAAAAGITIGENQIALVAHSAYSNPNGTNWQGKVVAMSVKAGDVFTVSDDMLTVVAVDPNAAPETPDTPDTPDVPVVKETIAIDGKLDDDGYDKAVWFSDGIWQSATGATLADLDVSYTVRSDDDNIYLTIKVNQGVDFEKALDLNAWDQSGATNFRIWLLGDGMETRTFYDLLWDGEAFVPFRQKTATDELTFAAGIGDDYINMEIAIAKSSLNITDSFKLMVTYSTPHCLNADGTTAYNAFHMTACEEMPSGWSGNADAYESYNCGDIALGTKAPATGDESVLVFAVLGLLAIAGAAVAIKVKG